MKLVTKKTALLSVLALSVGVFSLPVTKVLAQDDTLLSDTEEVLDSAEPIDVDGNHNRPTEADRMAKMRQKLEAKNEELVRKKIEDIRMKEEMRMTKRLNDAFTTGINNMNGNNDEVKTVQAAPVVAAPVVVAQAPAPAPAQTDYNFAGPKIIPNGGLLSIKADKIDFESKFSGGIALESMVTPRFGFGLGFNYATMDITDLDNTSYSNYSTYYNNGYYGYYGQGRELNYKHMNVELDSKLFLAVETRVRPYVGVGVAFNKTKLQYSDKGSQYTNSFTGTTYGEEEYASTFASGVGIVGAETIFNKNLGLNVEFKYAKGLTNMSEETATQTALNPDQEKLNRIGRAIEDASFMSINAGLILSF